MSNVVESKRISVTFSAQPAPGVDAIIRTMDFSYDSVPRAALLGMAFGIANVMKKKRTVVGGLTAPGVLSASPVANAFSKLQTFSILSYGTNKPKKGSKSASVSQPQTASVYTADVQQVRDGDPTVSKGFLRSYTWLDSRNGVTFPNWERVIASGGNATTAMTAVRTELRFVPGQIGYTFKPAAAKQVWSDAVSGMYGLPITSLNGYALPSLLQSSVDNGASAKFLDKLYALEHSADIGESLAEYRQTLALVGNPLQQFYRLQLLHVNRCIRALKERQKRYGRPLSRFSRGEVAELNGIVGSSYLIYKFGVMPLIADLSAAFEAIDGARASIGSKISTSFKADSVVVDTETQAVVVNFLYYRHRELGTVSYSVRYQAGIRVEEVKVLPYLQRLGVIPERFVPTIYAILPYSWLLDYFTGLSTAIDAVFADMGLVSWMAKTTRKTSTKQFIAKPDEARTKAALGAFMLSYTGTPSAVTMVRHDVARSPVTGVSAPPTLKLPSSWKPYANILGLLAAKKLPGITSLNIGDVARRPGNDLFSNLL